MARTSSLGLLALLAGSWDALPLSCFLCATLCDLESPIALLQYPFSEKQNKTKHFLKRAQLRNSCKCAHTCQHISNQHLMLNPHHQWTSVFPCGIAGGFGPACAGGTLSASQRFADASHSLNGIFSQHGLSSCPALYLRNRFCF